MRSKSLIALDSRLIGSRSTGDSTYWQGLVHGLGQIEREFEYLFFSNVEAPQEIPDWVRDRWKVLPGRSERLWSLLTMPKAARASGAALVHGQYNMSPLLGKRAVTTVHDVSFFVGPQWFKQKDRILLQKGVPSTVRRAGWVITVSERSRADIESFIPSSRDKISVTQLAPGIGIKPISVEDATVRTRRLGVEQPYVLALGTRWPRKNMNLAVESMRLLAEKTPHKLVLTGKAGWGSETESKNCVITGYVSDEELSALYCAADAFLMPSFYEGFGIPILEAFLCGCPVVTSVGGALPDVAGGAALVVEGFEPEVWAKQLQAFLADSSNLTSHREAGFRRVAEFSWEQTARLTEEAYQKALA